MFWCSHGAQDAHALSCCVFDPSWCLHLNAFDGLVDGFEQGSVRRVLVALFVTEHVGQSVHIGIKVLFTDGLLLKRKKKKK